MKTFLESSGSSSCCHTCASYCHYFQISRTSLREKLTFVAMLPNLNAHCDYLFRPQRSERSQTPLNKLIGYYVDQVAPGVAVANLFPWLQGYDRSVESQLATKRKKKYGLVKSCGTKRRLMCCVFFIQCSSLCLVLVHMCVAPRAGMHTVFPSSHGP